jgi:hypothetical protein
MKSFFLLLVLLVSMVAGAEGRTAAGQEKTAEMGGVKVPVTLLDPAEGAKATIDFQLIMDTHMGALPADMRTFAKLVGEGGAETPPSAWSGGKGGHHLSGRLSFPAAGSGERGVLTLVLKSADGRNDMRFEWRVPSKSVSSFTGGAR